ncbi:MAG: DUF4340 domain-containing protein [Planctomycetota bacterium]
MMLRPLPGPGSWNNFAVNFKTTLVLLLSLAALAGLTLLLLARQNPAPPVAAPPTPLVTGRTFTRIVLRPAVDAPPIELDFEDGRWWQTEPVRFPVADDAVENLVNTALALIPLPLDDPPAPTDVGLAPPRATITYHTPEGSQTLRLGDITVAGTAYLGTPDRPGQVRLVDAALHRLVQSARPAAWRPEALPTFDPRRVTRIERRLPTRTDLITRSAERWSLGEGETQRARPAAAERLAAAAADLRPLSYVSDDPAALTQYGLDEPNLEITLTRSTGQTQTLRLGSPADLARQTVYATWSDTAAASPVVFTLATDSLVPLFIHPDSLRDPRLVTADPAAVRGLRVNRVGRDLVEIRRQPSAGPDANPFSFTQPQTPYAPDQRLALDWLGTLHGAEPTGWTRAPREAQAPLAVAQLQLAGDRAEFVRLYADRDGREDVLLAVRENESVAALVPREQLAPLLAPLITLRDRTLPPPSEPITAVRLTRDDQHEFLFEKQATGNAAGSPDAGAWTLSQDPPGPWEEESFARLLAWLETPLAQAWTPLPELPRGPTARLSLGPDRPAYTVSVDQNLATRTDLPGVFRLPPGTAERFAAEYRDRLILPLRSEEIASVQVAGSAEPDPLSPAGPRGVTLRRGDDGVFRNGRDERYEPQADAAAVFNAFAGFTAKRILDLPPDAPRAAPVRTFTLETSAGESLTLRRGANGVWSHRDQSFYISPTVDQILTRFASAVPAPAASP